MVEKNALDANTYKVGYAKPPDATRFQKGKSGNPLGRPKTSARLDAVLKAELDAVVSSNVYGVHLAITRREAMVRRLFAKALRGDVRAIEFFLQHIRKKEAADPQPSYIMKFVKTAKPESSSQPPDRDASEKPGEQGSSSSGQSTDMPVQRVTKPNGRERSNDLTRFNNGQSQNESPPTVESALSWTGRMRAPAPYRDYYVGDRRYRADANGIIEAVLPEHRCHLVTHGCVDA